MEKNSSDRGIIKKMVRGTRAVDGAGVNLVRVLGADTMYDFDPFLMMDSFDSRNPDDYTLGFPLHPHRGIETVTYLIEGEIEHRDILGNKGSIRSGESQWMTAGRGILHEEMPKASPRMLGLQLWLNLPQESKMVEPAYFAITDEQIPVVKESFGEVRVVSGHYGSAQGVETNYVAARLLDIALDANKEFTLELNPGDTSFIFLIEGDAVLDGQVIAEKTAVLLDSDQTLVLRSQPDQALRVFFFSAKPLGEPIAWGGPIVMNTREELRETFEELERGTFIRTAN
ncbi:MAG TPA: pirin family protein [Coriobacteriia bacterium]|nr:pirin family protein [Coriobacteriia bacterium]